MKAQATARKAHYSSRRFPSRNAGLELVNLQLLSSLGSGVRKDSKASS